MSFRNLSVFSSEVLTPHWCLRFIIKKQRFLEYFTAVPDDFPPLRRCLNNPELMDVVADVEDPRQWLFGSPPCG